MNALFCFLQFVNDSAFKECNYTVEYLKQDCCSIIYTATTNMSVAVGRSECSSKWCKL